MNITPQHRRFSTWLPWALLIAWMGLIFFLSHQSTLPSVPGGVFDTILKKLAHALAYALLMALWQWALQSVGLKGAGGLFLALTFTLLYAISDEWHQTFIPGRNGQPADVLIDFSGALLALIVIRRFNRKP